jgi:hypothetical protein
MVTRQPKIQYAPIQTPQTQDWDRVEILQGLARSQAALGLLLQQTHLALRLRQQAKTHRQAQRQLLRLRPKNRMNRR